MTSTRVTSFSSHSQINWYTMPIRYVNFILCIMKLHSFACSRLSESQNRTYEFDVTKSLSENSKIALTESDEINMLANMFYRKYCKRAFFYIYWRHTNRHKKPNNLRSKTQQTILNCHFNPLRKIDFRKHPTEISSRQALSYQELGHRMSSSNQYGT